ncbi:alpha/beta fold hydrolase [Gracilibacillus sp. YIM 98692]|uniref:alpha/beta hydrolase n=1 Tax=Gracilibacillus sp. YIM 98692 TaxID=2663532 RepID=UPI0013D5C636|nr:alpha/beta fold hydrolase [Gracilibacillus sp. YIM 98692]
MKVKQPEPFMFEGDERAVLLLHGFTGHSADVRMLGRYLNSKGYTCYAPIYRGHGKSPEELVQATASDWREDVEAAYHRLQAKGYQKIAVAGLSLGGVLGLKLAANNPLEAVVTMCSPMFFDNEKQLTIGFEQFATEYKQLEKKDEDTIKQEVNALIGDSQDLFQEIAKTIKEVKQNVDMIYTPTLVIQSVDDEMINPDSAKYIHEHVEADEKALKWYDDSGHAITFGPEKDKLHKDIEQFFASLDW